MSEVAVAVTSEMIANAPFRERFRLLESRGELTLGELALRVGITKKTGEPDIARMGRRLGVTKDQGVYRQTVSYDLAVRLCDALHIDYFEVGL